ncbi:MAG: hypothetical protein IT385_27070 [Deltaproteobacteria bacterium]|nr:hypothetical protein [Deltaproteobacteria bacterium]
MRPTSSRSFLLPFAGLMAASAFPACSSEPTPTPALEPLGSAVGNLSALDDNLCMAEVWSIIGDKGKDELECTAKDVSLTELVAVELLDDGCAFPGDKVTMNATFRVELTAEHRYDIGIYFSENGASALNGNADGGCRAHTLAIAESQDREAGEPDTGNYCSGGLEHACSDDADCPPGETCEEVTAPDTCGDMSKGTVLTTVKNLTMVCKDDDLDSLLDFVYCSSWRQGGANDLCTTPYAAYPGSPSKCLCAGLATDIVIEDPCKDVACDAKECNGPGVCDATRASEGHSGQGLCVYEPQSGGACTDDGNDCTTDVCDAGACAHEAQDGAACGTRTECTEGVCVADTCTVVEIAGACDDGVGCTSDACVEGACVNFADDDNCHDGVDCTVDVCDAKTGCSNTTDDTLCDDGVACTKDVCTATGCSSTPDDAACNDNLDCTDDVCTEQGCSFTSTCDDGIACTTEVCTVKGCSLIGTNDSLCEDGADCTLDECTAQGCVSTPDHSACNDGVDCTVDKCDSTGCTNAPNHDACADSNECTDEACTSAGCVSTNNTNTCSDDGDQCTTDVCADGYCRHLDNGQCVEDPTCETAFALASHAFCDEDVDGDGRVETRWGWYGILEPGTESTYPLYAGAGQCDINKGTEVGYVTVSYDGETAAFTLVGSDGFGFDGSHVYADTTPLWTLAPGRFTSGSDDAEGVEGSQTHTISGFSGEDIYFSVHASACGDYDGGGDWDDDDGDGGDDPGGDVDPTGVP